MVDPTLACVAWDNKDTFITIHNERTAEELLARLIERGMDERSIIARVARSRFPNELLIFFSETLKEDARRWPRLVDAIMLAPTSSWASRDGELSESTAVENILEDVNPTTLFTKYRLVLCDDTHPLFEKVSADPYWRELVREQVIAGNYERAWHNILAGFNGLLISNRQPERGEDRITFNMSPRNRCYKATLDCRRDLVRMLFEAMEEKGEIKSITPGDRYIPLQDGRKVTIYQMGSSRRRVRAYERFMATPQFIFALGLGSRTSHEPSEQIYVLDEEAAMAIALSWHFFHAKNNKKKKAYERALKRRVVRTR